MTVVEEVPTQKAKRAEIIEAARRLAAAEGWSAVTLRRLAASIGCSAPAIYQYFTGKEDVLLALAEEGDRQLAQMLAAAGDGLRGPAKRLRAVVDAYWRFAVDNPELYAVMHGCAAVGRMELRLGMPSHQVLLAAAADLIVRRHAAVAPAEVADRLVAILHGFISMALAGRLDGGLERARGLLRASVEDLLDRLGRD